MTPIDGIKLVLMFANAFAGVIAASADIDPMARLLAAALVAGCGAVLLFLNPLGKTGEFTAKQVNQLTDALLKKTGKA